VIDGLATGVLAGAPQEKMSASGKAYVQAKLRVPVADGESVFVLATAFDGDVRRALLALQSGDSVALSGTLKLGVWTPPQGGEARINVSMIAHALTTAYHVKRRREAVRGEDTGEAARPANRVRSGAKPEAGAAAALVDDELEPF
jgi:single-stranded DNA-binding protein